MESLLKELGDGAFNPEMTGELTAEEKGQERMFKDAWSKIFSDVEPSTPATATPTSQQGPTGSFQDRIKQTMDKMKEGQSSLKVRDPQTRSVNVLT